MTARSSTALPGSWVDRADRHGDNSRDNPSLKPLTRAACNNNAAPPEEISDSLPASTRTPTATRLRFTYGVPLSPVFF